MCFKTIIFLNVLSFVNKTTNYGPFILLKSDHYGYNLPYFCYV